MRWTRWIDPPTRRGSVCLGAVALVLAGCGGADPDAVELDPPEVEDVEEEPEPEEPDPEEPEPPEPDPEEPDPEEPDPEASDAPGDEDGADDDLTGDGDDPGEGSTDDPDEDAAALRCDLAATDGSTTLADEAYERAVLETNFELELLAMELSADLDELLSGVSDGPTLEAQLLDHQQSYVEITSAVEELGPPDGADQWHERAMGSFDAVCHAIADGLAGSAEGDEDRFDTFVEALTGFPSVLNQLHANAACGPFEAC